MVWALSTLKDEEERILIPGFYDQVRQPTERELAAVAAMPPEEDSLREELQVSRFLCDAEGIDFHKRHMFEPTCTICGIDSGYTGEGTKTVLPATAKVKLDFRLVPDQRPADILDKLRKHLDAHGFSDIGINYWDGVNPSRTDMDSPFVRLGCGDGQGRVRQRAPVHAPSLAGSGPMYYMAEGLGLPVASSGVSFPDDKIHAPNENVRIDYFLKGILHAAAILDEYGKDG